VLRFITSSRNRALRPPQQTIKWLLAELIVVVGGVFVALSLEGLFEERQERRDEQLVLQALQQEFVANRTELDRQYANYERRLGAAEVFLKLGPSAADLPTDSAATLWSWYLRGGTFDPVMGTLDGLLATGRLDLIQDAELRASLAAWPSRLENMTFLEITITDFIGHQLYPWLREQSALPPGGFGTSGVPEGRFSYDPEAIHSSRTFENLTRELIGWDRALLLDKAEVDQVIEDVLEALSLQLR
jgi:hypothetical protein